MKENTKKTLYLLTIVLCLSAAAVIFTMNSIKDPFPPLEFQGMHWIKCRNPQCEHEWQMDKRDYPEYIDYIQETTPPTIVCPKCGEQSGYRAEKCLQCGLVFERGSVPNDFADRCPSCAYSDTEIKRKRAREGLEP
jgi:ribosomal protein L40E